jgi:type II secretory pathway pseudopilin PulG
MKENLKTQEGITLIEVLVSIVLVSIILISFIGFFTQSAIFTQKNGQKLGTVQTSQKFINLIKDVSKDDLSKNSATQQITTKSGSTVSINKTVIDQLLKQTYTSPYTISAVLTNVPIVVNSSTLNLIQFKIIVQDPNDPNNKSETYTYIRK